MSRHSVGWLEVSRTAPMFAALGDETRLALVARLSSDGPLSITRLTAGTAVTRQAVTKHLSVLATAGLVSDLRRGRERIWELEPEQMEAASSYLEQVSKRWDDALGRLKQFVEEGEKQ
jgi:DNA-binding transcriptional ArsR family regulator